jgi:microcystin-dependent protein
MAEPFLGQIIQGGWTYVPDNYASCAGQLMPIAQNSALFALLGTTYGGDGISTFALPDLQGRSMVNIGQGPGLSSYALGQKGGTETVTLTTSQMPAHTHPVAPNPNAFNAANIKSTEQEPSTGAIFGRGVDTGTGTAVPEVYLPAGTTPTIALGLNIAGSFTLGAAGGSTPVPILSPYLAVTVCIALQGIFPSRP